MADPPISALALKVVERRGSVSGDGTEMRVEKVGVATLVGAMTGGKVGSAKLGIAIMGVNGGNAMLVSGNLGVKVGITRLASGIMGVKGGNSGLSGGRVAREIGATRSVGTADAGVGKIVRVRKRVGCSGFVRISGLVVGSTRVGSTRGGTLSSDKDPSKGTVTTGNGARLGSGN